MSIGLFGKKYVREDIAYLFYQKKAESSSVKHINGKKGYQIYEKHGTLAWLFSAVYVFKLLTMFSFAGKSIVPSQLYRMSDNIASRKYCKKVI